MSILIILQGNLDVAKLKELSRSQFPYKLYQTSLHINVIFVCLSIEENMLTFPKKTLPFMIASTLSG